MNAIKRAAEILRKVAQQLQDDVPEHKADHDAFIALADDLDAMSQPSFPTLRARAAMRAMQGLLANSSVDQLHPNEIAHDAAAYADALIAHLARTEESQ